MKPKAGLSLFETKPQCSWAWFSGPQCEREATIWAGSMRYCASHAQAAAMLLAAANGEEGEK